MSTNLSYGNYLSLFSLIFIWFSRMSLVSMHVQQLKPKTEKLQGFWGFCRNVKFDSGLFGNFLPFFQSGSATSVNWIFFLSVTHGDLSFVEPGIIHQNASKCTVYRKGCLEFGFFWKMSTVLLLKLIDNSLNKTLKTNRFLQASWQARHWCQLRPWLTWRQLRGFFNHPLSQPPFEERMRTANLNRTLNRLLLFASTHDKASRSVEGKRSEAGADFSGDPVMSFLNGASALSRSRRSLSSSQSGSLVSTSKLSTLEAASSSWAMNAASSWTWRIVSAQLMPSSWSDETLAGWTAGSSMPSSSSNSCSRRQRNVSSSFEHAFLYWLSSTLGCIPVNLYAKSKADFNAFSQHCWNLRFGDDLVLKFMLWCWVPTQL